MLLRSLLAAALIAFTAAVPAFAAPFTATYTFTGSTGNQASEPVDSNPVGALLSDITRGSGIDPLAGANSINSDHWTTALTPDLSDFYEWTITPLAGYELDVTDFAFTSRRSATGPLNAQVRTSLDGFSAPFMTVTYPDVTSNFRFTIANPAGLGGVFNVTAPVTFRIYGYAAEGATGSYRLGIDVGSANAGVTNNLELLGDLTPTAVPEPTTLLLLGTGAAGLLATARRRT